MSDGTRSASGSTGNLLLDAVLAAARAHVDDRFDRGPLVQVVDLEVGQVVHQPEAPVGHVYFPRSAVVGLMTVTAGAPQVEVMAVGYEGVVGLAAVLGDGTSPHRAFCQVPGQALQLPAEVLRELAAADPGVQRLLGLHLQAAVVLLSQRVACSQRHTAQQRCADWLLRHADRVGTSPIPVTHQFLASMLGLRRTTVSAAAAQLQHAGLISYRYGRVRVRDHPGLQRLACSCYLVFHTQSEKLTAAARDPAAPG